VEYVDFTGVAIIDKHELDVKTPDQKASETQMRPAIAL
jgi:hypothetical protein